MKIKTFYVLMVLSLSFFGETVQASTMQLPEIMVIPIEDKSQEHDYELYIKLPDSYYDSADKKHPGIYIADARWHIEVISGSIKHLLKDAILVGISWDKDIPIKKSRMRDYTIDKYKGGGKEHPSGQAQQHLRFLKDDVFAYVESKYRVDPTNRTYFGYSMSGTFGSYILLTQPKTFKNYIIGAPAPLLNGQFLHEYTPILETIPESLDANVFVAVGSDDKPKYTENAFSLVRFLKSITTNESNVEFKVIESAGHSFAFPMSAMQSLYWLADISK